MSSISRDCVDLLYQIRPYSRIGVVIHAPTKYVREEITEKFACELIRANWTQFVTIIVFDPNFEYTAFAGIPSQYVEQVNSSELDCVLILSEYTELLYHFFNHSHLRKLPVIAPKLKSWSHRLCIRRLILDLYKSRDSVNALEIGCIEHPNGGNMTTKAIDETILDRGSFTTIDINEHNLQVAKFHCSRPGSRITYLHGDCREVLKNAPFEPRSIDFFLPHFSDYDEKPFGELLLETFILAEPYLSEGAVTLFQALPLDKNKPDTPIVGMLQKYLLAKNYAVKTRKIENTKNPNRWFITATSKVILNGFSVSELMSGNSAQNNSDWKLVSLPMPQEPIVRPMVGSADVIYPKEQFTTHRV